MKGFGLVPGATLPCICVLQVAEGAPGGRPGESGMGSPSHTPLVQTGPFSLLVERKSERSQAALWLSLFHPGEPVVGRVIPAEELGKRQGRARRPLQRAVGELRGWTTHASPGKTACVSHLQALIWSVIHLAPLGRTMMMVAGHGRRNKVRGSSAINRRSQEIFHGMSAP